MTFKELGLSMRTITMHPAALFSVGNTTIIVVTEKLKEDLKNIEKLYGYNTDSKELLKLSR